MTTVPFITNFNLVNQPTTQSYENEIDNKNTMKIFGKKFPSPQQELNTRPSSHWLNALSTELWLLIIVDCFNCVYVVHCLLFVWNCMLYAFIRTEAVNIVSFQKDIGR